MKKINCGGFYINEDDFNISEEGKLNLKTPGPLILTMVPTSQANPLQGTWTGATWEEVQSALMSGRDIVTSIPGFSYVKIDCGAKMGEGWELSALYIYPIEHTLFLIQSILGEDGTYSSNIFSLTKAN